MSDGLLLLAFVGFFIFLYIYGLYCDSCELKQLRMKQGEMKSLEALLAKQHLTLENETKEIRNTKIQIDHKMAAIDLYAKNKEKEGLEKLEVSLTQQRALLEASLANQRSLIEFEKKEIERAKAHVEQRIAAANKHVEQKELEGLEKFEKEYNREVKGFQEQKAAFERLVAERTKAFPYFAKVFADFRGKDYESVANWLVSKSNPAPRAAQVVQACKMEISDLSFFLKDLEYKVEFYETSFPELKELFDDLGEASVQRSHDFEDDERNFLSRDEWLKLTSVERSDLALKRYLSGPKTKWQLGRDYEQYTGYMLEKEGFQVDYFGIEKRFKDLGRDLIAKKRLETRIIQCKYWSKNKEIHEKHIFQLYGTIFLYKMEFPEENVFGYLVTSTKPSNVAQRIAHELKIIVQQNCELGEFPRVKLNINKSTGERIYHLPFDQQYDRTLVNQYKGEGFAFSASEAEEKGFRRAKRYFGEA